MSVKKKRGELSNGLSPDERSGGGDYQPRPAGLDRATELKLIDAALLNDMQAFSELFEHYRPDLHALCLQRLNDPSLAEDVVQEVFLKAFASLPNSDHRRPIWPWLSTIAYRMCVDLQRRRSFTHYSADIEASVDAGGNGQTESALDSVIASQERADFWKSLDVLPERQRRVFLSYALDDLSCAEIAAAEGISLGSVHLLLFRARKKMRSVYPNGRPLPAIVLPFTWLRWKFQRIEERIHPLLGVYGEGFASACVQAACLSTVAMMVVAAGHPAESLERDDATPSNETFLAAAQPRPLQPLTRLTAPNIGAPAKTPAEPQQSVANPSSSLVEDVINPSQNATPENSSLSYLAISPNYERDHTIFASGHYAQKVASGYSYWMHVMFVSQDGGANWKPQVSRVPFAIQYKMVISPGYPQDRRLFMLGTEYYGLQQSDDGGETFRMVSPVVAGSLAISPLFGRGDSKILMGGDTLLEYDADTGVTRPASPFISLSYNGSYSSVTFSPGYSSDRTVFVSDRYSRGKDLSDKGNHPFDLSYDQSTLYRCKESVCDEIQFPFDSRLTLRLSPRFDQDGLAYAFTESMLFVSNDGGLTFREIPLPNKGSMQDVAVSWNTFSDPAVFVLRGGVYRSLDGGFSWTSSRIDVPGFGDYWNVNKLIVTPTGRLLVTSSNSGLACSEDIGETWAPRCPPER